MKLRADAVFFRIGRWIWIPAIAAGFWFAGSGYDKYHQLLECSFQKASGLPCPGCGGTRAVYYLFSGEILKSFQYHPVVIYGILAYIHFMALYFYRNHVSKRNDAPKAIQLPIYAYGAIVIIIVQWFVKILRIIV